MGLSNVDKQGACQIMTSRAKAALLVRPKDLPTAERQDSAARQNFAAAPGLAA